MIALQYLRNISLMMVLLMTIHTFGQKAKTDSLESIVNDLKGKEKIKVLSDLCYYLSYSDVEKSKSYGEEGLNLALEMGDSVLIANAYNDLSILYTLKGDYQMGLDYNLKAYAIRKNQNDPNQLISSLSKIGVCYSEMGKFEQASVYVLEAIKILEANNLEDKYFIVYDNLGGIFKEMKNYENALIYHQKAYDYAVKNKNTRYTYTALVNIAGVETHLGQIDQSIEHHLEAEKLTEQTSDLRSRALIYSNLASLYSQKKQFDKAIAYSDQAIEMYQQLDNFDGLSLVHNNMAQFYMDKGQLSPEIKAHVEFHLTKAQNFADSCHSLQRMSQNYDAWSRYYSLARNFEKAMEYKIKSDSITDELFQIENNKIVEELKTKYESEKKEKEIVQNLLNLKQKNYQLIIILGVMVFIILGAVENYRKFKFKQKRLQEEARLKDELAEIKIKSQIQGERLRISRDLHDNIGSQLTFIISSIDMARYTAQNGSKEQVTAKLQEIKAFSASTIDEFRDTIWALNKESINLNDLELKLSSFISKAKSLVQHIHFSLLVSAKKQLALDSETGIKLFRIIQEAVNNAIKHSEAKEIGITIFDENENIVIQIADKGKGVVVEELERTNGLNHMKTRAQEIGAGYDFSSHPGQGTTIKISCQRSVI